MERRCHRKYVLPPPPKKIVALPRAKFPGRTNYEGDKFPVTPARRHAIYDASARRRAFEPKKFVIQDKSFK